jgi:hypothetical protein
VICDLVDIAVILSLFRRSFRHLSDFIDITVIIWHFLIFSTFRWSFRYFDRRWFWRSVISAVGDFDGAVGTGRSVDSGESLRSVDGRQEARPELLVALVWGKIDPGVDIYIFKYFGYTKIVGKNGDYYGEDRSWGLCYIFWIFSPKNGRSILGSTFIFLNIFAKQKLEEKIWRLW